MATLNESIESNGNILPEQEREKLLKFANRLFPEGATIITNQSLRGEIGQLGWKTVPKQIWIVRCNLTQLRIRLQLRVSETIMGDLWYLWDGEHYRNLFYSPPNKDLFEERVTAFIKEGCIHQLIC